MPKNTKNRDKPLEAQREQRRKTVAANLLAGLNYRQMADALDVSIGTIAGDVKIIFGRWQKEQVTAVNEVIRLEVTRLDQALNAIWSDVAAGKPSAINVLLKIMERRARLLGLDDMPGSSEDKPLVIMALNSDAFDDL